MKRLFCFLSLFALLLSCALNASQEKSLNNQMGRYLKAYNEGRTLELSALTHVSAVKYYQDKGDSAFLNHFYLNKTEYSDQEEMPTDRTYLENYTLKDTKSEKKSIQCKYSVKQYNSFEQLNDNYHIFAISEDDGKNWFFLTEEDYFNKEIKLNRFFKQ